MKKNLMKIVAVCALSVLTLGTLTGCGGDSSEEGFDTASNITVISREDGSGTRGAFIELTGVEQEDADGEKMDMTTVDAQITNSQAGVLTSVAGDEYSMGYASLGALTDTVKALNIDGVEPTVENIQSGDYSLARPFNVAIKEGNTDAATLDFMAYIMSPEAQAILEDLGYVPSSETVEYTSTNPTGTVVVGGSTSVSPVMEKVVEAYNVINPDVTIEIQSTGSTAGMESTISGAYDIGMASREIKDSELEQGLEGTVICMDGLTVIVNPANPLTDITTEQIKEIYTGNLLTWAEITE